MTDALSSEQLNQVINNTVVVILARPDLHSEWNKDLNHLLRQARAAGLEAEAIFVSAVINLLAHPDDVLPTGTQYDNAWDTIRHGLETGSLPGPAREEPSIDRLLETVVDAVVIALTEDSSHLPMLEEELHEMRATAAESGLMDLLHWLDNVVEIINGTDPRTLQPAADGAYAAHWQLLIERLESDHS